MNNGRQALVKIARGTIWEPLKVATLRVCERLFPWGIALETPETYLTVSKDSDTYRHGNWNHGKLPRVPVVEVFPEIKSVGVQISDLFNRTMGTSLDAQEIVILSAITKLLAPRRILEVGTYDGNTALNLALNSPAEATVTTLDLPQNWSGDLGLEIPENAVNVQDSNGERVEVGRQYKSHPEISAKITQVFGDSARIDWGDLHGPFDLIFIDGCHDYSYVRADTENATRYLSNDGVIVWHDYGEMEGVSRLVDEVSTAFDAKSISGTRFAVGFGSINTGLHH